MIEIKGTLLIILITLSLCFAQDRDRAYLPHYPYNKPLYSGYLPIEGSQKSLHYVFVPSQKNHAEDPVLLWLNGGPGCSSLEGFSSENGPAILGYEGQKWQLNPYSWNKKANVLYIESPAGVGFSYNDATNPEELKENDDIAAVENLKAVVEFFNRFPKFRNNEFYISGESYAGIYLPYLASQIVDYNNENPQNKINLKGMFVGNGVTDWKVDADIGGATFDYAYTHALYSPQLRESYENSCLNPNGDKEACQQVSDQITNLISSVNIYSIYDTCYLNSKRKSSSLQHRFKYTPWLLNTIFKNVKAPHEDKFVSANIRGNPSIKNSGCYDEDALTEYYNKPDVKRALNVRLNIQFEICKDVNYTMDFNVGSYHLYPKLIASGLRIVKFSGDNDMCVPFNGSLKWIKNLGLPIKRDWRTWFLPGDKNLGGMVTEYQGLTFVTIRGAGHMVPQKKPAEAFYLINQFLQGKDF